MLHDVQKIYAVVIPFGNYNGSYRVRMFVPRALRYRSYLTISHPLVGWSTTPTTTTTMTTIMNTSLLLVPWPSPPLGTMVIDCDCDCEECCCGCRKRQLQSGIPWKRQSVWKRREISSVGWLLLSNICMYVYMCVVYTGILNRVVAGWERESVYSSGVQGMWLQQDITNNTAI